MGAVSQNRINILDIATSQLYSPSVQGILCFKSFILVSIMMTKKRTSNMQLEPLQLMLKDAERADIVADNNPLDTEMECPSCQNIMGLYSVSESSYYSCDDCKFCLYTKW
jgi:hypothetical protein